MNSDRHIYVVRKCTTDQLARELNDINYDAVGGSTVGEVMQITHTGGRDWVVIHRTTGTLDDLHRLAATGGLDDSKSGRRR